MWGLVTAGNGVHVVPSLAIGSVALTSPFLLQSPCAAVISIDLASGRISLQTPGALPNLTATARSTYTSPPPQPSPQPLSSPSKCTLLSQGLWSAHASLEGHHGGLGELALCHKVHKSGYIAHPALVDCSLHIGASMGASQSRGLPNVPVGLGSFLATAEPKAATTSMWAAASLGGAVSDQGNAAHGQSSSYQLHGAQQQSAGILLQGLLSKPMRDLPGAHARVLGVPASAGAATADALYSVLWQVSHAAARASRPRTSVGLRRAPAQGGPVWMVPGLGVHRAHAHKTAAAPLSHSCGQGLAILQHAISQQPSTGSKVHLITPAGPSHGGVHEAGSGTAAAAEGAMAAAAAGALFRVAASENPSMRFAALEESQLVGPVGSRVATDHVADQDAFGARSHGGALQLPRLTTAGAGGQATNLQLTASSSFTITGGLGGQCYYPEHTFIQSGLT